MFKTGTKELFRKYHNKIFIETGSFIGDGIQAALDAGFETVYSIEISKPLYDRCVERFKGKDNVHLICGDSLVVLEELLSKIDVPVSFWLDGHNSGEDTETGIYTEYGIYERPLIYELQIIGSHFIKTHTLLIDDMRLWSIEVNGYDTQMILNECKKINPDYKFDFVNGYVSNDILIAWL